ncbi:aspartyl protease family protein At5g10770-like [Magnolia sinica]|uniref:aspartyl protease family protein At5g10770-like n=1 Tax=Magnolia sinica TaxID=86752 RepID=UPI0026591D87|nr:aspartyl protease family protein At5g10770-like [Magnolia sinica]
MYSFKGSTKKMGLVSFLVFSLLFVEASLLKATTTQDHCSSKIQDDQYQLNNSGIHLTLHHVHGPCSPWASPPSSPLEILKHDQARVRALSNRLAKTTRSTTSTAPKSISVPLNPGESAGVGNYVVRIGLGSPAKSFLVVMDTGSSFSWVQCEPCGSYCHPQTGPTFDPSTSHTYKSISCNSSECSNLEDATLNPPACSSSNICEYEASYGDGSFSVGYLSRDTLTVVHSQTVPGFVYGCGQNNQGLFGRTAGLIGLARNPLSLLGQLSSKYGYTFSYCLPTLSSSGTLSIGSFNPSIYTFTRMYTDSRDSTLYFLRLTSMIVNGKTLRVSRSTYTSSHTIIDSGTVITRLPPEVYTALQEGFVKGMGKYTRAPPYSILDTCYNGTATSLSVPEVRLIFEGGAELKLAARNVMYEVSDNVSCLAFASNEDAGGISIIGNTQQQTFRIVYDVSHRRIGFAGGGCD